jgi:osmoprotectant transport system permease protein
VSGKQVTSWLILGTLTTAFIIFIANSQWVEASLRFLFPQEEAVVLPRASLLEFFLQHVQLVAVSSGITIMIGVPLGIWVTRTSGRDFLPLVTDLTSFGQTFPPVAVLALVVPVLGFGFQPTVAALILYGLLPVVRNTITGLKGVPWHYLDAARGMGMSRLEALFAIEIPLAAPVIIAGIRISVIVNIGTATIGAIIGAGGLGSPIIAGLIQDNLAFILEGAVPAAVLAILIDQFLANIERLFAYPARA